VILLVLSLESLIRAFGLFRPLCPVATVTTSQSVTHVHCNDIFTLYYYSITICNGLGTVKIIKSIDIVIHDMKYNSTVYIVVNF